jgi:hypothetical protein
MACVDEDQRNDAEAIQAAVLGLFHMALDEMRDGDKDRPLRATGRAHTVRISFALDWQISLSPGSIRNLPG